MAKSRVKKGQMPDDVVEAKAPIVSPDEEKLISQLFEYTKPKALPYYNDYMNVVKECYNFKERRQWDGADMQALASIDVPVVSVDRIGRSLDTINGIRTNTGSKKRIVKREMGDDRIATILDKVADFDDYNNDFANARNEAFDGMLDVGIGIRKIGYDPQDMGGEGAIFSEYCETEDVGYSRCKKKNLEDIVWAWHRSMMNWEEAMLIAPEKSAQIKSLQTTLETKWEEIKSGNVKSNFLTKDYGAEIGTEADSKLEYAGQVYIYDFWQKKIIPVKKIGFMAMAQMPSPIDGMPIDVSVPQVKIEPLEYEEKEGEQVLATTTQVQWCQYIVASGRGQTSSILLKESVTDDHPFVGMCAYRRKSGMPTGFIEKVIDYQKRINIAWAQKTAFNNKSIKSPIVVKGNGTLDLQTAVQQSSFGAIFDVGMKEVVSINTVPNVNLQAIEEGNIARQDMDFAAAASEPVMRGMTGSTTSGVQLAQQQNAAITPLNTWVKGEQESELLFWRKWLYLAITNYKPERYFRILGQEMFQKLVAPKIDPMTGQIIAPPVQLPLQPDVAQYDVIIQDQSVSDFQKQQSFNAIMAMQGMSPNGMFDNEFIIKNAPIKNTDDALASSEKHRNDMMFQMQQMMMQMQNQISELEKSVPKDNSPKGKPNRNPSQPSNAMQGRNASQAGQRSMVGGQLGM